MSLDEKDFYGKEVTEAIKNACESLQVAQERLEIEVVETGSSGIFGLRRKKAHIRVKMKPEVAEEKGVFEVEELLAKTAEAGQETKSQPRRSRAQVRKPKQSEQKDVLPAVETVAPISTEIEEEKASDKASSEALDEVRNRLLQIVELMGFPSTVELEVKGTSVNCTLRGEYEDSLIGTDGKVLDSLQYLLRKIAGRTVSERLRITVDVGDFRERRLEDLKTRAMELAALVKEDGKTQALPALNPSERRAIHMILQEDKEIRSRSVGDGIFKKILIYKPGKGNRSGGRKRSQSSHSRAKNNKGGQQSK